MTLAVYRRDATDEAGNLLTGVDVEVRNQALDVVTKIYSDAAGTTPKSSSFVSADGKIEFYAPGGVYKIILTKGAYTRTLTDERIGTAQGVDIDQIDQSGIAFGFEAETSAPPSAASIRADNADLSAATKLYIADDTLGGTDVSAYLIALDPGSKSVPNKIRLFDGASDALFDVDGTTDQSGYVEIDVSGHDGATALVVGTVRLTVERSGAEGAVGARGADGQGANFYTRVRLATTGDVTIPDDLEPGDTLDGETLAEGDLVLVGSQTDESENGIYLVREPTTNKCENYNANPTDTTGLGASAGVVYSFPSDGPALADAGLANRVNRVVRVDVTGAPRSITISGVTGNTNDHTSSVYMRAATTGLLARIQLLGQGSSNVALDTAYQRLSATQTPSDGARTVQIVFNDDGTYYMCLHQLEEQSAATLPIEVAGASAAASTARDAAFDEFNDFPGLKVAVVEGTANGGKEFKCTAEFGGTIDTNDLIFVPAGREALSANRTYYVDDSSGSDSNAGRSSGAGAFATLQKAADVIFGTLDLNGYDVTVSVADGTYTDGMSQTSPQVGAGLVTFEGNTSTPASCIVSTTSSACFNATGAAVQFTVNGFELRTTTSGNCVESVDGAKVTIGGNMRFGTCATRHVSASRGGSITIQTGYEIVGNATAHIHATQNGIVFSNGDTFTLSGTPAFTRFCDVSAGAAVRISSATFSGTGATGARYLLATNGIIDTNGGGATYFPGNSAGSAGTGGQYV